MDVYVDVVVLVLGHESVGVGGERDHSAVAGEHDVAGAFVIHARRLLVHEGHELVTIARDTHARDLARGEIGNEGIAHSVLVVGHEVGRVALERDPRPVRGDGAGPRRGLEPIAGARASAD